MNQEDLEFISQEGAEVLASYQGYFPTLARFPGKIFIGIKEGKVLFWEDWEEGQVIFFCEKDFYPKFVDFISMLERDDTMDLERLGDGDIEEGPDRVSIWLTDPYRGDDFQLNFHTNRRFRNTQESHDHYGPFLSMPSEEFPKTMLPALREAEAELKKRGYL